MSFLCFNGAFLHANQPLLTAQNRGFRYGDGLFETMKVYKGKLLLNEFHFERLFLGLGLLKINAVGLSEETLAGAILQLCQRNQCSNLARVRLAVYRDETDQAGYLIEAFALEESVNELNEKGWVIDIYPHARKSQDAFANLKTANYLPYVLADKYAMQSGLDECLVLNSENYICDGSKTNFFLFADQQVYTPALHQGCVSGTMRRFIMEGLKDAGISVHQKAITEKELLAADEIFLTNAIQGIRWVKNFRQKNYSNEFAKKLHSELFAKLIAS